VVKCERNRHRSFKKPTRIKVSARTKRGGVVNTQSNPFPEQQGFTTEDILWALGIWSVILSMSPVVVFYMLMVA